MEKTTLDDKAMLNDLLITCKQRMSAYSTLIAETTCPNLRTMLQDLFRWKPQRINMPSLILCISRDGTLLSRQSKRISHRQKKRQNSLKQVCKAKKRPSTAAFLFVVVFHQDIQRHRAAFFHHLSAA